MATTPANLIPSTPEATAAEAQTRRGAPAPGVPAQPTECPAPDRDFDIGKGVLRAAQTRPYERDSEEPDSDAPDERPPLYRPLRIYTLDPTVSCLEGSTTIVNVPYEPLKPGPVGHLLEVDSSDGEEGEPGTPLDLEDPRILIRSGRDPSPSDHRFQQQMAYAVASNVGAAFQKALGRRIAWGFDRRPSQEATRLVLRPRAFEDRNAFYNKDRGEVCFGYFKAEKVVEGLNLPEGRIYACLAHDIVAHEMTHALLDGLRAQFTYPSGPDVMAFHEGFADLVALFQRFTYKQVVLSAIRKSRGNLADATLLTDIGRQFGQTTGARGALRSTIDLVEGQQIRKYDSDLECHDLGLVLVHAVFEAFMTVFRRRIERYLRLATGGTGMLPAGALPADLQDILAHEASKIASQFLNICIRAIDYCPPVDLEFGEFLRAIITADFDLVPDDSWDYRGAWIDAFQRRAIYPGGVNSLAADELLWDRPEKKVQAEELTFARLQFEGDPGRAAGPQELCRQARALGKLVTDSRYREVFGLAVPGTGSKGDTFGKPCVESIRSSRRVGPDGQIVFDLIAEVIQTRTVRGTSGGPELHFHGGATVILDPQGKVRYVIRKRVTDDERLQRQRDFVLSAKGQRYWQLADGRYQPRPLLFRMIHQRRNNAAGST